MPNRIRDFPDPFFPLGNPVWFDPSFPDESRQFIIDEGWQVLTFPTIEDGAPIPNTECGVNQCVQTRNELVGKGRTRVAMKWSVQIILTSFLIALT